MAHVAQWKRERVEELIKVLAKHPVVGIVDLYGIPAKQLAKMRGVLRGKVDLRVAKTTLLNLALDEAAQSRPGLEGLKEDVVGQCGLVLTGENPFKLFRLMESTKTRSPARGGETATEDIVIRAGDTGFKPGPVIREFQKVGIPAAIERGKVVIKRDATLVTEGEVIPKDLASVLPRLEILPLLVGLDLKSAYDDGVLYRPDVLNVDMDELVGNLSGAAAGAFNLAINIGYPNPATVRPLLAVAHSRAVSLALGADLLIPETAAYILVKAQAHAWALASRVPDALDEELKQALQGTPAPTETPEEGEDDEGGGEGAAEGEKEEKPKKEEKKVSDEEAAAGLSALFG